MVRTLRTICAVCCVLALLTAVPCRASAATVYDGSISNTYVQIYKDLVPKLAPGDEYVMFRYDQYAYHLVAGALEYDDVSGIISGDNVTVYAITTNGTYTTGYTFIDYELDEFSLAPGTALVYSSLGPWPQLTSSESSNTAALIFGLAVLTLMSLLREIFRWVYRTRGAYVCDG